MAGIGNLEKEITEEDLREIHELQAEGILTSNEEKALLQLLDVLKRLRNAFNAVLADNDLSNSNAIAKFGEERLFYRRVIAMLRNPEDKRYNLEPRLIEVADSIFNLGRDEVDEALPRLYRMIIKAKDIRQLIISIEKGEIKLSKLPWQKGKPIIRKIIQLDEEQKKNISRKIVGLGETRNMLVINRRYVGDIWDNITRAVQTFGGLRGYVQTTPWHAINEGEVKSRIEEYRIFLNNAHQLFDNAIIILENVTSHIDDFKHWLAVSVNESQRALQFQEKLDEILKSQGIGNYRDGHDKSFGKPWG